jgi:glycosyltransferase involved in cell wall biosynthesis
MAHGLPVISSDLPTSKEIMGDLGIYFENGNTEQLAQRMREVTSIDWPDASAKALLRSKDFDVSNIIKQWKQLIER